MATDRISETAGHHAAAAAPAPWRRFWERLAPRSEFLRNVSVVAVGTFVAQSINTLVYPVLTRLYEPADFGLFALFFAVYGTIAVISCLRYEMAIMIPDEDDEASDVLKTTLCIVCGAFVCVSLFAVTLFAPLARLISAPRLAAWWSILPLMVLFAALYAIATQWCSRRKHYTMLAVSLVVLAASIAMGKISLALLGVRTEAGLVLGQTLGQGLATLLLVAQILRRDRQLLVRHAFSLRKLTGAITRHKGFALYAAPQVVMNRVASFAVLPILTMFSSTLVVGLYALSRSSLELPARPLLASLDQVFYQRAAREHDARQLEIFVLKGIAGLASLLAPALIFAVFQADALFGLVFGPVWVESASYFRVLALPFFGLFLTGWTVRLFDIKGKQRLALHLESGYLVMALGAFWATLVVTRDPLWGVIVHALVTVLFYALRSGVVFHICQFSLHNLARMVMLIAVQFALWGTLNGLAIQERRIGIPLVALITLAYYGRLLVKYQKHGFSFLWK